MSAIAFRVHKIDPLQDARWGEFLSRQNQATIFHSREWLRALQLTYGYAPVVLTTSSPKECLSNAVVFCRVRSWLTGSRLVSLPFSDHCSPLVDSEEAFSSLFSALKEEYQQGKEEYIEIRDAAGHGMVAEAPGPATFCLHRLDLRPSIGGLFDALHESCIRRKILRAHREQICYEEGRSQELLQKFYRLIVLTRRRHRIPPPPLAWFHNLIACLGSRIKIRIASMQDCPVAGILTLQYKDAMIYKYGCSDPTFHKFGPVQLLLWKAIQEAKESGLAEFDMGRTDWCDHGLLVFKDRWGASRSALTYLRYPAITPRASRDTLTMRVAKAIISQTPARALPAVGSLLYRHVG